MTNDDIEYHCFVTGEVIPTDYEFIYAEWYAQDEADAARWDEAMGIDDRDEDNY